MKLIQKYEALTQDNWIMILGHVVKRRWGNTEQRPDSNNQLFCLFLLTSEHDGGICRAKTPLTLKTLRIENRWLFSQPLLFYVYHRKSFHCIIGQTVSTLTSKCSSCPLVFSGRQWQQRHVRSQFAGLAISSARSWCVLAALHDHISPLSEQRGCSTAQQQQKLWKQHSVASHLLHSQRGWQARFQSRSVTH